MRPSISENRIDSAFPSRGEEVLGGSNCDAPLDVITMGGRVALDTRIRHSGTCTLKVKDGRAVAVVVTLVSGEHLRRR